MHGPGGLLPSRRQSHITAQDGEKETCRQCASDIKLWLLCFHLNSNEHAQSESEMGALGMSDVERDDDASRGMSGLNREVKMLFSIFMFGFSSQLFLTARPATMKYETITLSAIFIH